MTKIRQIEELGCTYLKSEPPKPEVKKTWTDHWFKLNCSGQKFFWSDDKPIDYEAIQKMKNNYFM